MSDPIDPIEIAAKALNRVYCDSDAEADERWADVDVCGHNCFVDARAVIAALEKAGVIRKWQPIETTPKDGAFVMLFCVGSWCPSIARWNEGIIHPDGSTLPTGWGDELATFHIEGLNMPTHWMPLPDAPTYTPPAEERK